MHDHSGIYPTLPAREMTDEERELMVEPNRGHEFETCWEFKLTHEMTEREGSAFWHGALLVYEAMKEKS